jgi:beta-lactamase class A
VKPSDLLKGVLLILFAFCLEGMSAQNTRSLDLFIHSADSVRIAVHVQNTDGMTLYQHRPEVLVVAASIIKIPVMMALYSFFSTDDGQLAWQEHRLREEDKSGGAGSLQFVPAGTMISASDLVTRMISQSDNTATNILLDKMDRDTVNVWLAREGYTKTRLNRRMMDMDAIQKGLQNYTTAAEISGMLLQIYNHARLGSRSAAAMLSTLHQCDDTTTMPAGLPSGTPVAHKTGLLNGMRGDAGIIFLEKPLIVSIFVEGCQQSTNAESIIASLTRMIVENFR